MKDSNGNEYAKIILNYLDDDDIQNAMDAF